MARNIEECINYKKMIEKNLKSFNRNREMLNKLLESISSSSVKEITNIINEGADLNGTNQRGETPLYIASFQAT